MLLKSVPDPAGGIFRTNLLEAPNPLEDVQSRRDAIYALLEDKEPGVFSWNQWHLVWESSPNAIQEPSAVAVELADVWDFNPLNFGETHRIALVWDGEVIASRSTIEEGESVLFEIAEITGERLELWLDEGGVPATVRVKPRSHADEMRAELQAKAAKQGVLGQLQGAADGSLGKLGDGYKTVGYGLLAVALVAGGLYLASKYGG